MNDEQAEIDKAIAAAALDEIEHYQAQLNGGDCFIAGLPEGTVLELPPPPYVPRSEITFAVRRKPLDPR